MFLWNFCNDFFVARAAWSPIRGRISLRVGWAECVREQQYRYGEPEWDLGEKPKMRFTVFIQPLTLSRRFLTPRKVTPEVLQWLVSRALVMVLSLGLELPRGRAVGAPEDSAELRNNRKGRRLSGNTVRPQQTF